MTCGYLIATGPLLVTYTSCQIPMFLSGGAGFQSTQVSAKSSGCGGNTSTASVLTPPGLATSEISNSKMRKVPATSFASAILCPFNQIFALKLIPSKCNDNFCPRLFSAIRNSVLYHQELRKGLSSGIATFEKFCPIL